MANLKTRQTWKNIWDRLTAQISVNAIGESPMDSIPATITEPLTLYVETTGNDVNAGTLDAPYRTIQAAIDSLKNTEIAANVTIKVGVGNFDGFALEGLKISSASSTTPRVVIQGTPVSEVTGTCTSQIVNGLNVITDNTKNWIPDEHVGKQILASSGGAPITTICFANTATTLSVLTTVGSYTSYEILRLASVIQSVARPGNTATAIFVGDNSNTYEQSIQVDSVTLTRSNVPAASIANCVNVRGTCYFNNCFVDTSAGNAGTSTAFLMNYGLLQTARVVVKSNGSSGFSTAQISGLQKIYCTATAVANCATGFSINDSCVLTTNIAVARNCTTGFAVSGGKMVANGQVLRIDTCTTGALASDHGDIWSLSVCSWYGTGNTLVYGLTTGGTIRTTGVSTITGTTEINVDGVTATIATMRGNTPKIFPLTPNPYGTYIYE